jgi:hypothetical protein
LDLFAYTLRADGGVPVSRGVLQVRPAKLRLGESCEITYSFMIPEGEPAHIRVEYAVDFVRPRGKLSRKAFLLWDKTLDGGACISGKRIHRWAELSTRRHYPGDHKIVLLVNGREAAAGMIELIAAPRGRVRRSRPEKDG